MWRPTKPTRSFSLDPGHQNLVGASKRPFHTIIPGFVTENGAPRMAFGVMGGHMQPQGHVQMITRIFDYGLDPQAAAEGSLTSEARREVGEHVVRQQRPRRPRGIPLKAEDPQPTAVASTTFLVVVVE